MSYLEIIHGYEQLIRDYSLIAHATIDELSQFRNVEEEEERIKMLDDKGGIE